VTRFGFERCRKCGRLNIHLQRCECTPREASPPIDCDCTYTGNEQHIGARCQKRIDEVWSEVFRHHTHKASDEATP